MKRNILYDIIPSIKISSYVTRDSYAWDRFIDSSFERIFSPDFSFNVSNSWLPRGFIKSGETKKRFRGLTFYFSFFSSGPMCSSAISLFRTNTFAWFNNFGCFPRRCKTAEVRYRNSLKYEMYLSRGGLEFEIGRSSRHVPKFQITAAIEPGVKKLWNTERLFLIPFYIREIM